MPLTTADRNFGELVINRSGMGDAAYDSLITQAKNQLSRINGFGSLLYGIAQINYESEGSGNIDNSLLEESIPEIAELRAAKTQLADALRGYEAALNEVIGGRAGVTQAWIDEIKGYIDAIQAQLDGLRTFRDKLNAHIKENFVNTISFNINPPLQTNGKNYWIRKEEVPAVLAQAAASSAPQVNTIMTSATAADLLKAIQLSAVPVAAVNMASTGSDYLKALTGTDLQTKLAEMNVTTAKTPAAAATAVISQAAQSPLGTATVVIGGLSVLTKIMSMLTGR